jgi:fructose-1,6-bisphosphatase I
MTQNSWQPGASRQGITLETFIMEGMIASPGATGYFTSLLNQICLAARMITARVRAAGLADALGYAGTTNVQGERVMKLDQIANDTLCTVLARRGHCAAIVSEELGEIQHVSDDPRAKYIVLFDPLDGSSNIDVNVAIGTIFAILKKRGEGGLRVTMDDILRPGRDVICAGYLLYSAQTMLVFTTGRGVHGFTYDPQIGEFFLSHENMRIPERGNIYSVNEGNAAFWHPEVRDWAAWMKEEDKATGRPYSHRYVGSLVADAHRTLVKGGVFAYPEDARTGKGKLRLLYEANPFAFIFEAAGGAATDGRRRILDIEPKALHDRVPLILGSREDVERYGAFLRGEGRA